MYNLYFIQNMIQSSTSLEELKQIEKSINEGSIQKEYIEEESVYK